jgi:hypothetical protein
MHLRHFYTFDTNEKLTGMPSQSNNILGHHLEKNCRIAGEAAEVPRMQ